MTTIKDIAWVAGLLEGEGAFGVTKKSPNPIIWLHSSDVDIVEHYRNIVNKSSSVVLKKPRHEGFKIQYACNVSGSIAIQWMMTIYSLMGIRRKAKIRMVIEIWKAIQPKTAPRKVSSNARARQGLANRLRRRGYSDIQINIAKTLLASGKMSEEQVMARLEELINTGVC
jgi:hypothetical protein